MKKLHIFGVAILILAFTGCGADEEERAMREEIATLNKYLNNLQASIDKRKEEIAGLHLTMQEKDSYSITAQKQIQALEDQIIASEKSSLEKMAVLEKKLEDTRKGLMIADEKLSARDQEHDSTDETLMTKANNLTTEVDTRKKEIKNLRKELISLKSVVEQQTFQLLQLHQNEELEETGMNAE
jgi:chromosome segregation ATPase